MHNPRCAWLRRAGLLWFQYSHLLAVIELVLQRVALPGQRNVPSDVRHHSVAE